MKYTTLMLGLAILMASMVAALAGPDAFVCGKNLVAVNDQPRWVRIELSGNPRIVRTPVFVWDTKTNKATLNGKPCSQNE